MRLCWAVLGAALRLNSFEPVVPSLRSRFVWRYDFIRRRCEQKYKCVHRKQHTSSGRSFKPVFIFCIHFHSIRFIIILYQYINMGCIASSASAAASDQFTWFGVDIVCVILLCCQEVRPDIDGLTFYVNI